MISAPYLATAFDRNVHIIKMQSEGLVHEDSLIQLPFRANCLNWVVGHLVTNRNSVLKLLGGVDLIAPLSFERYMRDSDPITAESEGAIPLEILIQHLEQTQAAINQILADITDDELSRNVAFFGNTERTVGEWLLFFFFHDAYHTGQTEILRQASGTDDKII